MMNEEQIQEAVLRLVAAPDYQPLKPRRIARQLQLDDDQARLVKRLIKQLVQEGRLTYAANHAVCLPQQSSSHQLTGIFRRMSEGYGFVRPQGAVVGREREEDVYIPKLKGADAASGDLVLVQLSRGRGGKRGRSRQGVVVKVLQRETHHFVGTYFERSGYGFVQVDGKIFAQPILVGDAGAKNVRVDDKVVIEMVRFPSHVHDGEGVVLEVLGQRGQPGVDTLSIIHEFNLPGPFAPDVLEDAREQADSFDAAVEADRRDLTDQTVITIDPEDARDFDDAISLDQIEGGHWRLGVHIADVAHFVREKSPLDREARQRATSVYLPDRVIPMLPETISNNLASLQPHRVRYTKSVFIEFAPDGAVMGAEACAAAIRSQRRFTYEEVDDYRANPRRWRRKLKVEVYELLGRMYTLAMILRKRRFDRGALELTLPEVKIDLDRDGRVAGAHLVENTESHQVIEEFMLAANEAMARILQEAGIVFLRRIHEPPDPRKLQELTLFARELGLEVTSLESRFALQGLLNQLEGRPEEHAVSYATLRSMQKAVYSPAEEGHFALASDCYCHFTSPIRRYPDLTVHRLLDALLASRAPRQHVDELANLGDHCSQREQRAEQAERELIKVKLLNYLSERIGEEMDAVVTGVQEFGLFVQGVQLPAEGLIHVTSLQDDYYHYDRGTHSLSGHRAGHSFRLGDYLRVAVAHVDVDRRELDFRLVRRLSSRPAGPAPKPKTQRAGKTRRTRKPSTPQRATPRSEPASPPPGKGRRKTAPQGQVGEGKKDRAKKGRAKKDGGKNSRGKKGGAKKGGAKNSRGKKSGAKPGGGKKGAAKKGRGAKKGGQRKGKK